jgi:hypothetical protein
VTTVPLPPAKGEASAGFAPTRLSGHTPIMSLGLSDAHPPLHHERVIAICAPLFMEKRHALTTATGNNGPCPIRVHRSSATATLTARYKPIGKGAVLRQTQRANCWLVGDERNSGGYTLKQSPSQIEPYLVLSRDAEPDVAIAIRAGPGNLHRTISGVSA